MKTECEQCQRVGFLQQPGNYYRVSHHVGIDPNTEKQVFLLPTVKGVRSSQAEVTS